MTTRTVLVTVVVALAASLVAGFAPQEVKPAAGAARFKVDPVHSTALFRVHHLGAGRFWGRFDDVKGSFPFAEGSASDLAFDVTIGVQSVDTPGMPPECCTTW